MSKRVTWGETAYAGFWLRFAGRIIDTLLIGTVASVLAFVLAVVFRTGLAITEGAGEAMAGQEAALVLVVWLAFVLPDFLYDTLMTSKLGWTVGKRAVGVEVRRSDGELLSYGQAVGRWFGRIVSSIPLYLGFLWAAWDRRKQTWHDKFVKGYVVKSAQLGPPVPVGAPAAARPWGGYSGWGIPQAQPGSGGPGPQAAPAGPPGTGAGEDAWGQQPAAPGAGTWGQEPAGEGAGTWGQQPAGAGQPPPEAPPPDVAPPGAPQPDEAGAGHELDQAQAPPDEPAAAPGEPEPTDWGRELDWESAAQEQQPRPAVEGESLEAARWAGSAPAEPPAEAAPGEPLEAAGTGEPPAAATPGAATPGAVDELLPVDERPPARPAEDAFTPGDEPRPEDDPGQAAPREPASAGTEAERPAAPRADDPNLVGVSQAGIPAESAAWLEQVADQVDTRLDRVTARWRSSPQAEAARACAFGLLLGHLATIYPHMTADLSQVAEAHPSFSTLPSGNRLGTLQRIVGDPGRTTAWLGPLIGADDPADVQRLLD